MKDALIYKGIFGGGSADGGNAMAVVFHPDGVYEQFGDYVKVADCLPTADELNFGFVLAVNSNYGIDVQAIVKIGSIDDMTSNGCYALVDSGLTALLLVRNGEVENFAIIAPVEAGQGVSGFLVLQDSQIWSGRTIWIVWEPKGGL